MPVSLPTSAATSAIYSTHVGSTSYPLLMAAALCSAFFECADNMGIFEWNTVSNTFVQFFGNITGYVSVAPGDDEVLVVGYDSNVNARWALRSFNEGPISAVHQMSMEPCAASYKPNAIFL